MVRGRRNARRAGEAICGQPAAADNALALAWLHENPDRLVTCGARHLRVWQVDASLPKLHPMDAIMGSLKRVMRCVSVGTDDAHAYVGTTTGEVLKFAIGRDGIQLPNDPDRVRPKMKKVSSGRSGNGVCAILVLQNPKTGNDNVVVGAGDGKLSLYNTELNPVAGKKEQLMGAVTSIATAGRAADSFTVATSEGNRYRGGAAFGPDVATPTSRGTTPARSDGPKTDRETRESDAGTAWPSSPGRRTS